MVLVQRIGLCLFIVLCLVLLRVLIRAAMRNGGQRAAAPPVQHAAAFPRQQYAGPQFPPPAFPAPAIPAPKTPPAKPATNPGGGRFEIVGLTGEYAGQRLCPGSADLVFGRDAAMSHVVFSPGAAAISKRHCRVFANAMGRVWIEDTWSSNGTYLAKIKPGAPASTERLEAGAPHELKPGDAFCLGGPDQMFRLEKNA